MSKEKDGHLLFNRERWASAETAHTQHSKAQTHTSGYQGGHSKFKTCLSKIKIK
jgi:hypothetical protein